MSATIEVEKFQEYLGVEDDNMLQVEGRCHPIQLFYVQQSQSDYVEAMLNTILQIHFDHLCYPGDILAFLTG